MGTAARRSYSASSKRHADFDRLSRAERACCSVILAVLAAFQVASVAAQIKPAGDAPQPLTPEQSAARIQLPSDLAIELVACEPLVQDPSCIAFDEFGRLFVTELHGYNVEGHLDVLELNKTGELDKQVRRLRWELMGGEIAERAKELQYGVLKLLLDEDGDGRMDRAEVWADDLPPCYGVIAANGGVIVVAAPDIVYFADRNGDGKVDVRETLFTGFDHGVLERGINNPKWGVDNWIYVGAGRHAGVIRGPHLPEPVELSGQDFRIKPDGSAIESVSGSVGTFGLAMNDIGDRFPCFGGEPAIYALPLARRILARNPHVATPRDNYSAVDYAQGFRISKPHPWRVRRAQDPAWVKFYGERENDSSYFSGGCGGLIYCADRWPAKYRDNFFYCEPSLNIVHRCILKRDGAGYVGYRAAEEQESEFLASTDQWFRPMNLRVGPDGAVYVVDMYREIIEDYSAIPRFLQQQYGLLQGSEHGRIWRLVARDKSLAPPSITRDSWPARLSSAELAVATGDANPWWRATAQRLLVERQEQSVSPALARQARDNKSFQARIHALHGLNGIRALQATHLHQALGDTHYGVRTHALRLSLPFVKSDPQLQAAVVEMTHDSDPRVRLEVAGVLGELPPAAAGPALAEMLERYGDERWMDSAVLSSSRQVAGPILIRLLECESLTAGAKGALGRLAATCAAEGHIDQLDSVLERLAQSPAGIQLSVLDGLTTGIRTSGIAAGGAPDSCHELQQLFNSPVPQVQVAAVALATHLWGNGSHVLRELFMKAAAVADDPQQSDSDRANALRTLAHATFEVVRRSCQPLLDARQPPDVQQAALATLAAADDARVGALILGRWGQMTPATRGMALEAIFARQNRIAALVSSLQRSVVQAGDLNAVQRERLLRNPELPAAVRQLLGNPQRSVELQQRIQEYQQALTGPRDLQRGKQAFEKTCLACHRVGEEGFHVGPALQSIVTKPDEGILLDLLDPSRHIEAAYRTYLIVTTTGRAVTGVMKSESATSVTLAKEKGVVETVLRSEIEEIRASKVSMMPSNLHEQLTAEDTASLIGYLRQLFDRKPGPKAAEVRAGRS